MNIVSNLIYLAFDAPIVKTDLQTILQMLTAAVADDRRYIVVSKPAKPGSATTVYCPDEHTVYRAAHRHGVKQFLKVLAAAAPENIRLLANDEVLKPAEQLDAEEVERLARHFA